MDTLDNQLWDLSKKPYYRSTKVKKNILKKEQ